MSIKNQDICIRLWEMHDASSLLGLMRQLAVFEHYDHQFQVTEADLIARGFGEHRQFHAHVAEDQTTGALVGMAVHYLVPFTFDLRPNLILKELYIDPQWRNGHLGKRLMQAVAVFAMAQGCHRIKWDVLADNFGAMSFYERLGGRPDTQWQGYIMDETAIAALAEI